MPTTASILDQNKKTNLTVTVYYKLNHFCNAFHFITILLPCQQKLKFLVLGDHVVNSHI